MMKVYMESSVYGREEFEYDTLRETQAAIGRLMKRAAKCALSDGARRRISIMVDDENAKEILKRSA
jgi:hypothetical protein